MQVEQTTAWKAIDNHFNTLSRLRVKNEFDKDSERFNKFSLSAGSIFLDYSKNIISEETMKLLIALAEERGIKDWTEKMFTNGIMTFNGNNKISRDNFLSLVD